MQLPDLAPGFVAHHRDPILFVTLAGRLAFANAAAAPVLDRAGLKVGDPLPRLVHEELVARLAATSGGATFVAWDQLFDLSSHVGEPAGAWLHARPRQDPVVDELRGARRAKAAFLAHASHDLRTPLNAILGYSGLLLEERPEDTDLGRIETAAHQLLGMVDQLLEVSRVEAGTVGVFHESFPVGGLLDALRASQVPVASTLDGALVLRGDQTKIRQVVGLVVDRLRRAGQRPSVEVSAGLTLTIGVPDASAATLRSLLEPAGADGLGTALAEALVGLLGGRIVTQDRAVVVTLPVEERRDTLDRGLLEIHGPDHAATVLVVDDDDASRDLLRRQLLRAGYRVVGVRDGEVGLEAARQLRPDVVTLDIVMPRMNGWEVLRRLKESPETASIPVVVVSIIDAAGSGFAVGASGFLTKPIDRGKLLRTLEAFRSATPRVLVVDDDAAHRALVARAVARSGWTVTEAADGAEALRALESGLPDVLLLDLFMPVVDGFAVVEAVRARPEWRQLPIVVVTALDLGPAEYARLADRVHTVVAKSSNNLDRLLDEIRAVRPARGPRAG
jgi:CheY-like chemotaxis protein/signal transduction histidine kinase